MLICWCLFGFAMCCLNHPRTPCPQGAPPRHIARSDWARLRKGDEGSKNATSSEAKVWHCAGHGSEIPDMSLAIHNPAEGSNRSKQGVWSSVDLPVAMGARLSTLHCPGWPSFCAPPPALHLFLWPWHLVARRGNLAICQRWCVPVRLDPIDRAQEAS